MALRIFNTLTRQKETFQPLRPGQVDLYVCGPTVYSKAHIGHAMSALVFDILRRFLEYQGYRVRYVMNYTDVDDKIIQRANLEGADPFELANRYILEYEKHLKELNVLPATLNPRATQEISQITQMIGALINKGYAYQADGGVYFRVNRAEDYGKLSRRQPEDMQAGTRISVDERKENPLDFALWKAAKPGEPAWNSPWGKGRPGWHIECSAMNLHHLGEQIDIHGGGNDLVFPHHENEIAQTESLTGKPFARYWVHNGMMQLAGEKMSKSLGNLVTIDEFLSAHEGDALRLMVLNSSYRNPLTYSPEVVIQAERALERLRAALRPVPEGSAGASSTGVEEALRVQMESTRQGFLEAMEDDFNTAGALGHLFDLVRAINTARDAGVPAPVLAKAQDILRERMSVFGLRTERIQPESAQAAPFIDLLVQVRRDLRQVKQYALADSIRTRLAELGVLLEDTREGTLWKFE